MTDNDIIKALECCRKPVGQACKECPLNSKGVDCLDFDIDELILDLINRQQAELERLERHTEMYHEVRAEAVKEFAERLKEKKLHVEDEGQIFKMVHCYEIDNLVKEMVGASDG